SIALKGLYSDCQARCCILDALRLVNRDYIPMALAGPVRSPHRQIGAERFVARDVNLGPCRPCRGLATLTPFEPKGALKMLNRLANLGKRHGAISRSFPAMPYPSCSSTSASVCNAS